MWETYHDSVEFFVVYIREAHPLDGQSPLGGDGNPVVEEPRDMLERSGVAQVCMTKLDMGPIPALIDNMDNAVEQAYAAHPDRLYLIGRDGKVAYRGGPGPGGFLPDELESAIQVELEKASPPATNAP